MSAPINDGGPAFPRDERYLGHNGMTLRDWFAGQALVGFLMQPFDASIEEIGETWEQALERIPRGAYGYADAMLVARAKGSGQ